MQRQENLAIEGLKQRMTSASGVRATADVTNTSEPESLDSLAYDDWEGQFEFVGGNNSTSSKNNNTNNSNNDTNRNNTRNGTVMKSPSSDVEDLNLTTPKHSNHPAARNFPILIDEETFLSMQSNDIDEPYSMIGDEQPNQLIENALKHLQFDNTVPSNHKTNKRTSTQTDVNNSSSLSNDNIIEMKNRRNIHSDSNNNSCCHSDGFKMSDMSFAHELYDSLLKEQVSDTHSCLSLRSFCVRTLKITTTGMREDKTVPRINAQTTH